MAGYYPGGKRREEELRTGTLSGEKALGVEGTQSGTGTISGENARMKSFQGGAAAKMPYQSGWSKQLNDTMDKILNREPFQYDLNGDALYQQYKDRYVQQGQQAMMDTMGQAAALTGGYGNSYAQAAGQQAYNQYLQGLDDRIPELYQLALDKYRMEGDQLDTRAAFLAQMDGQDYGRWLDNRNYQYQQGRDEKSDQQWQAQFDEDKWRYDTEWEKKYGKKPNRGGSGDGSSDSGSTPGTNPAPGPAPTPKPKPSDDQGSGDNGNLPKPLSTSNTNAFISNMMTRDQAKIRGITDKEYFAIIRNKINSSGLSEGEIRYLLEYYGFQ